MVEELISTLSKEIRTSITEDTSVPRNVRTNVVTGLETYLLNEKDDLDLRIYSTISVPVSYTHLTLPTSDLV